MSKNAELQKLYQMWRQPDLQFVDGGIVNEQSFEDAHVKVMFLMKEANDPNGTDNWSLVNLIHRQIQEQSYYETWKRVGELAYGLSQGFPYYQDVKYFHEANIAEGLETIAVTNLKKSGGNSNSDLDEIREYARRDIELWTAEISIVKPDVVVCGGTYWIVQELLGFDSRPSKSGAHTGTALETRFVDFYHPAYRISPRMLYAYFKEIMRGLGY